MTDQFGFPVPDLPREVEVLAESIADAMVERRGRDFDDVVTRVVTSTDGAQDLPLDRLAACISHARVLVGQHGVMTWEADGWCIPTDERLVAATEHDHRTAERLLG
ncbi:MAG TPA: hypothetical protein VNO31_02315 [Umezawaea sp.]|nr:hypothetical protein [Umezawaea sp.]